MNYVLILNRKLRIWIYFIIFLFCTRDVRLMWRRTYRSCYFLPRAVPMSTPAMATLEERLGNAKNWAGRQVARAHKMIRELSISRPEEPPRAAPTVHEQSVGEWAIWSRCSFRSVLEELLKLKQCVPMQNTFYNSLIFLLSLFCLKNFKHMQTYFIAWN